MADNEMQAFAGYWKHLAIYQAHNYMLLNLYFHYSEWKDRSQMA